MLKKAKKSQIIKKINVDTAFVDETSFYISASLAKDESVYFNIKDLIITIIPDSFVYNNVNNQVSSLEHSFNKGFDIVNKPLFIKEDSKNNNTFSKNDVEENSSTYSLFKSIYAKNIVSTFGQEEFLSYKTPVFFGDEDLKVKKFTCKIPLSLIEQKTVAVIQEPVTDITTKSYKNFSIKAYVVNDKEEVLDSINVKSKKINEYDILTDSIFAQYLSIENALLEFANSFNLIFEPYVFPISENIESGNLRGFDVSFDSTIIREIFLNDQGFSNEVAESLNISIENEDISAQYNLRNINASNINSFDDYFTRRGYSFSEFAINDNVFLNFVNLTYDFINRNIEVDKVEFKVKFNLSYSDTNICIDKKIHINRENIVQLYNDLIKYKFEKDIKQRRVISCNLSRFRQNLGFEAIKVYRLSIILNTSLYFRKDIIENNISLTFFRNDYSHINTIEKFYFDDSLTESNSIIINENSSLSNYFISENVINLYFSYSGEEEIKGCYINFFGKELNRSISIGPFLSAQLEVTTTEPNTSLVNLYQECSRLIGQNSSYITIHSDEDILRGVFQNNYLNSYLQIDFNSLIENEKFKSLGYFNNNLPIQEKITSLLNNIILATKKTIFINDYEINAISHYTALSDIIDVILIDNGSYKARFKEKETGIIFEGFDIENKMSDNLIDLASVNSFTENNILQQQEFKIDYRSNFAFILMKNDTVSKFGQSEDIEQSKQNLVDFVVNNNLNYSTTKFLSILEKSFSSSFIDFRKELFKDISVISGYNKISHFTNTIEFNSSNTANPQQDILLERDSAIEFQNVNSNKTNLLYESSSNVTTNLNINILNNSFVITKHKNDKDFEISGEKIEVLLKNYKNKNGFVKETFFYPEIQFNQRFTKFKKIKETNNKFLDIQTERLNFYATFNKDFLDQFKKNLSIKVLNNKIIANITNQEIAFNRFDKEYYSLIMSLTDSENFLEERRSKKLVIKNIVIRLCIVLNIGNKVYTILKNVVIPPSEELVEFLKSNNDLYKDENSINVNAVNSTSNIYMPGISYKGIYK